MVNWNEAIKINAHSAQAYDLNKLATKKEAKIDPHVSRVVEKPVRANDPRLIGLVVKYKKKSGNFADRETPDNFLEDPAFVKELKQLFNDNEEDNQKNS